MAEKILFQKYFNGGISDSEKEGLQGAFYFARKLDIFSDPSKVKILPKTVKDSGTTVVDLVKWIVSGTPNDTSTYFYGDAGKFYKRTSGGTWSVERTVAASGGQGMDLYSDYIYYAQNTQLGRYGPLSGVPAFTDAFATGLNDTSALDLAPVKSFNGFVYCGHGNKLLQTDGTTTTVAKLTLPAGLNIRALEIIDEFLVIATQRGTDVTKNEESFVFFWDGVSTNYNFFVKVEEGACNAILNSKNRLMSVLGSQGQVFMNYSPFQRLQQLPLLGDGKYVEIFPGAMTIWQGIALIGVGGATDSTTLYKGVYQWGTRNQRYPEILNFAWEISTGNSTPSNVKIGAIKGLGNSLFIGWRDDTTYGVDIVTTSAAPYTQGILEALIFDDRRAGEDKLAKIVKATHLKLAADESIQLGYKTNRAAAYTTGDVNAVDDTQQTRLPAKLSESRFKEFQIEVILNGIATSPTLTSLALQYDDLSNERDF